MQDGGVDGLGEQLLMMVGSTVSMVLINVRCLS